VADARPARQAAVRQALLEAHLDGLVVTALPNIRWLTGFSGSNALLVVTTRDVLLFTDFRYETQAADEAGDVARVVIEPSSLWTGLWRELAGLAGLDVLGFESAHLLHRDFARLLDPATGGRWQWRPTTDLVETPRQVKDPGEVAHIAAAAAMAEHALTRVLAQVRIGMTEQAICGLLERELREAGSETAPFEPIVATGPRSALPHARPTGRALGRGEFLLLDFGARTQGYVSDITRTVVAGPADGRQQAVHDIVREANARARAQVRAGMTGQDADALARRYIEAQGEGAAFGHSLGHGIGLEVHEAPRLSKSGTDPLPAGAVVTIEPGIYHAGWGGVRIEDDVVLLPTGAQLLTQSPRELLSVG
jgi:Xaa-Pro aminopeptidase